MYPTRSIFKALIFLTILGGLAACSSSAADPQQIAAFPLDETTRSVPPAPYPRSALIFDAYLALKVWDVAKAAEGAGQLAQEFQGYVEHIQFWYHEGRKHAAVTLAVPSQNFDRAVAAVRRLGTVERESIDADWEDSGVGPSQWPRYSRINLNLQPKMLGLASIDWGPAHTFRSAWSVLARIFSFLIDGLIWVVVLGGPFILMGWGAWALIKRLRTSSSEN